MPVHHRGREAQRDHCSKGALLGDSPHYLSSAWEALPDSPCSPALGTRVPYTGDRRTVTYRSHRSTQDVWGSSCVGLGQCCVSSFHLETGRAGAHEAGWTGAPAGTRRSPVQLRAPKRRSRSLGPYHPQPYTLGGQTPIEGSLPSFTPLGVAPQGQLEPRRMEAAPPCLCQPR